MIHRSRAVTAPLLVACMAALLTPPVHPQGATRSLSVTTPEEVFGFRLGADYCLADYAQLASYWRTLEKESERLKLEVIGKTEEGRDMLMAILTSPANHARLPRLKEISRRLALAEGIDEGEARALAKEGCAVVWIDGGLHASEVLVAQQLIETVYQLASRDDEETRRFLDDLVILCCNPNPDGQDLVARWYMREKDPRKRSTRSLPRLYQKYIGHDNNRDFYMVTQKETEAVTRIFYHEWHPQIVYNHHQTGPSGTVLFAPPFRDPFNHNYDPLVPLGIDLVGAAMHQRFVMEGKFGSTMRRGASYSTWWNGGLRTNVYFHNMIGLLTETIGHPTPMEIPLRLRRQLPTADLPAPIAPQKWHFRQSVEYSLTANRAVMDVASRHREQFLFNAWRMGRNSIERGNRDHWTMRPDRIAAARKVQESERGRAQARGNRARRGERPAAARAEGERKRTDIWNEVLRDPDHRDPRGYVLPSDQPDFPRATKFINCLIKNGIVVHRATSWFEVAGRTYPAGSYVVKCAQAFRPHVLDMFEPQVHPDDIPYPGGAPIPPYDSAGWTLAFQMGVEFDRILDGFDGPFERIHGLARPPAGRITHAGSAAGFLLSHAPNDSAVATNRLLARGHNVSWLRHPMQAAGRSFPAGTIYVEKGRGTLALLKELGRDLGLSFAGVRDAPPSDALRLRPVRIGLWDRYGGSMASGWMRWLLERHDYDFELVFPKELDAGDLRSKYDALVFVSGAIPRPRSSGTGRSTRGGRRGPFRRRRGTDPERVPAEYRERLGRITAEKTIPRLKEFLEAGGTICTIGSSTALASHLELPIANHLVESDADGTTRSLPREKFFVPGSILQVHVDTTKPLAWGLKQDLDVYFRRSPVFRLRPGADRTGIGAVAWFSRKDPLRSGWAWGQHYLQDGVAVVDARVGNGSLFLFGPEITFRAQPHGTFKLLFNALHLGPARARESRAGTPAATGGSGG